LPIYTRILRNQYHDSVALMLATRALKSKEDVEDAAYMMGTDINKKLLADGGLLDRGAEAARANDLIITVKGSGNGAQLLDFAEGLLSQQTTTQKTGSTQPGSLRSVIRDHPEANTAVISLAGPYAAREAREALASGLSVLLFSDNVSLQDEIALKKFALQRDLFLMGPGAGTAIINGVGLGFANAVPQGRIGIVSAAGTGLQEVSTLLARHNAGISQAIGTGGRDLGAAVGGLMFFAALDALQVDSDTDVIVLISKPPDPQMVNRLYQKLQGGQKPIVLCLLGAQKPSQKLENVYFTRTLEECAHTAHAIISRTDLPSCLNTDVTEKDLCQRLEPLKKNFSPGQSDIRGLFSGGTLCYEAQVIWRDTLEKPVYSNAPLIEALRLPDSTISKGNVALDLGEEEFTIGRPHPMIDNDFRIQRMAKEALDPKTAVILFDVVLGFGAHPDPAGELGEAIVNLFEGEKRKKHNLVFICAITGTAADPQGYEKSKSVLEAAGVTVCASNAQAARIAAFLVSK
jgi:FdrA protein